MPGAPQAPASGGPVCPNCGSSTPVRGLTLSQSAEVGRIGLLYRVGALFHGTETLRADLCGSCGTVLRLYVQDPKRKWITS